MKKIILILSIIISANSSFSQNRWSIGVMLGGGVNVSKLTGGMETANALFSNAPHRAGKIGVFTRYQICERFSFQSGYDFSEIGFTYLFAKNYSLQKNEKDHFDAMKTSTCISRLPVMMIHNSRPNCRNIRFVCGTGFALEVIDKKWKSETASELSNGNSSEESVAIPTSKTQESHATKGGNTSFTWLFGTEKVFKKGNMLSLTMQGNFGFSPLATSTVQYSADGTDYHHTFTNYGSSVSLGVAYYFLPVGSKKFFKANKI